MEEIANLKLQKGAGDSKIPQIQGPLGNFIAFRRFNPAPGQNPSHELFFLNI